MTYNFECTTCDKTYIVDCKMSELDQKKPDKCECGSDVQQVFKASHGVIWKTGGACGKCE